MRQWVLSFRYPLRFLFASRPAIMGQVLAIVYRCIGTHLIKKAGFSCTTARTGAVTLIQRFGSALNMNIHFHMLFLDGVYVDSANGSSPRFRWVKAPTSAELTHLTHTIARRVGRFLERQGLLERDAENSYLVRGCRGRRTAGSTLGPLHHVSNRGGPDTRAARCSRFKRCRTAMSRSLNWWARWLEFSLHAGIAARADGLRNWNVCAATSQDQRCRKSVCRSPPMATCATNSRRRTAMAPHTSLRTAGLHCAACRFGAQTAGQPDSLARRVRPEQRASCAGDCRPSAARATRPAWRMRQKPPRLPNVAPP